MNLEAPAQSCIDEINSSFARPTKEIIRAALAQVRADALEENARLKRHAEAMAELLRNQLETQAAGTWEWKAETESILDAYRAAKEGA